METKLYNFEVGKQVPREKRENPDKSEWPDYIVIYMDPYEAFDQMKLMMNHLQGEMLNGRTKEKVRITFHGELSTRVEE